LKNAVYKGGPTLTLNYGMTGKAEPHPVVPTWWVFRPHGGTFIEGIHTVVIPEANIHISHFAQ
jgi:hypothetical protein